MAGRAARVNPTEFALLGLLAERPRTGYDIKKEVEERLAHFWSESYGHIYPMLARLRKRRLITMRAAGRRDGRQRNVYTITASGRRTLVAWFANPPAPPRPRNELLLRLMLGRFAPPGVLLRDVAAYRAGIAGGLGQLRGVERRLAGETDAEVADLAYWRMILSFGIELFETLERWCDATDRSLRELG